MSLIDPDHIPKKTESVAEYEVQTLNNLSLHESIHILLKDISNGVLKYSNTTKNTLSPIAFNINQDLGHFSIAFPDPLFEKGNIAQLLSIVAGTIYETEFFDSIKIINLSLSQANQLAYPGPGIGIDEYRLGIEVKDRPFCSITLRPKFGLNIKEYLENAYHIWMGGCDIIEESEFMCSLESNDFYERIQYMSKEQVNCSNKTGEKKQFFPNITASTIEETQHRAKKSYELGIRQVVINAPYVGFTALRSLAKSCQEFGITLCAKSIGHGIMSGKNNTGIATKLLASLYRLLGVDQLHIGSDITEESKSVAQALNSRFIKEIGEHKRSLPICTNVKHPEEVEKLVKHHGHDIIIQYSDGVFTHPDGIKAGAKAFRAAIDAAAKGISITKAAANCDELKRSLEQFDIASDK